MVERDFLIEDDAGLHARPAAKFTRVANSYQSEIRVVKDNKEGNGKSLLSILALGIFGGMKFTIKIVGPDKLEAMHALGRLIESGFAEGQGR